MTSPIGSRVVCRNQGTGVLAHRDGDGVVIPALPDRTSQVGSFPEWPVTSDRGASRVAPMTNQPNAARCHDGCGELDPRDSFGLATSDASWHNTMTGHDVSVTTVDGDTWRLGDDGWTTDPADPSDPEPYERATDPAVMAIRERAPR